MLGCRCRGCDVFGDLERSGLHVQGADRQGGERESGANAVSVLGLDKPLAAGVEVEQIQRRRVEARDDPRTAFLQSALWNSTTKSSPPTCPAKSRWGSHSETMRLARSRI